MSSATLALSAAFGGATGALYIYIGNVLRKRNIAPPDRLANYSFVTWWMGLGTVTLIGALNTAAAAAGLLTPELYLALNPFLFFGLCLALAGLLYYLIYVYSGRRRAWIPVLAFYSVFLVFLNWLIQWGRPVGVSVGEWGVSMDFARDLQENPWTPLAIFLLIIPVVFAAMAYFTLAFRLDDREAKARVLIVSLSFIAWFGLSYIATITALNDLIWWPLTSRLISLASAGLILAAFTMPPTLRRMLRLQGNGRPTPSRG